MMKWAYSTEWKIKRLNLKYRTILILICYFESNLFMKLQNRTNKFRCYNQIKINALMEIDYILDLIYGNFADFLNLPVWLIVYISVYCKSDAASVIKQIYNCASYIRLIKYAFEVLLLNINPYATASNITHTNEATIVLNQNPAEIFKKCV